MTLLYLICAAVGCTVLVVQFLLTLLGVGHHDGHWDAHHDDGGILFGVFSIRAMSAASAAFGMAGMAALKAGVSELASAGIGMAVGFVVMSVVVILLRVAKRMDSSGTLDISAAVDKVGTVYVPIATGLGGSAGGKVHVDVKDRTVELAAVTSGPALATGTRIRVVRLLDGNTAEVIALDSGKVG